VREKRGKSEKANAHFYDTGMFAVFMVITFIALLQHVIKNILATEQRKPPGLNPAA
jgi:hypothetical protein